MSGKHSRHKKLKNLTPDELELDRLLTEDKLLTRYWYDRMSGRLNWVAGEKELTYRRFDEISEQIRRLLTKPVVAWFARLVDD